jgi:glycosyltransferase involved in cell wall biosynthesis
MKELLKMNFEAKVSVGIPVYNGEKTLARALDSILNQTYFNLEIIISDNCSTDSTPTICKKYIKKDSRIKYVRSNANIGAIKNFNHVFNLSHGEFFMWVAHDDEHAPSFISECVDHLKRNEEAALCAPRIRSVVSSEVQLNWISDLSSFKDKKSTLSRYLETLRNFPAVAIYGLYRSSMIKRTSLLPNVMGSDLLFIQNLSLYGTFIQCDKILFTYFGREEWNTVDQDFHVFYGKEKKPFYYSPFAMVSYHQIKILKTCEHSVPTKIALLTELISFQLGQIILKIVLKLIKFVVPGHFKMILARKVYWRYIHSPNIQTESNDEFEKRIIRPIVGLRQLDSTTT